MHQTNQVEQTALDNMKKKVAGLEALSNSLTLELADFQQWLVELGVDSSKKRKLNECDSAETPKAVFALGSSDKSIPVIPLELFGNKFICVQPKDCDLNAIEEMFKAYPWTESPPLLLKCEWGWEDEELECFWCYDTECRLYVNKRGGGGLEHLTVVVDDKTKTIHVSDAHYYVS